MGLFSKRTPSTQEHLDILDMRDDLVIMKNGVVALILETSSLNFELLSEREQDMRILSFSGLLNSLNFHIQIYIRTQRTDLRNYIELLEEQKKRQISEGLRYQLGIYTQFIKNLTVTNEVLEKRFFIIIPSSSGFSLKPGLFTLLFGKKEQKINVEDALEKTKVRLYPRRDHIIKQLKRMGLFAKQLTSSELIKLFYEIYNPDRGSFEKIQLTGVENNQIIEPKIK